MPIGSISSSALSAIAAYGTGLNVTANNLANVNSKDFRPSTPMMNEDGNGAVKVTISKSQDTEVDIAKEMVDMMIEASAIKANIKTLQTEDQVIKNLIDIKV
ncbi:MAG TPA: flagellar basal body rod C-terminal domain-containing protein [Dissulfurispiraceae bacterium]|nr:flagellar basal body rod C-terminal domain-containing protein [Dissulfurispiraceae bacterium]